MIKELALVFVCAVISMTSIAQPGLDDQKFTLALGLLQDRDEGMMRRVTAARHVLMHASEDRLPKYLGMEGPMAALYIEKDKVTTPNVSRVGHRLGAIVPDIQIHFEIAAMMLLPRLEEEAKLKIEPGSTLASTYEKNLIRIALATSAVVGAKALNDQEQAGWDHIRAYAVQRAKDEKLDILDLVSDHDGNVKNLAKALKGFSEAPWVSEAVREDVRKILEARLK